MVLPLLFSFLGGGLAKAGVLGAAGSFLANPLVASSIGSGIGTLVETGDPKKALLGGLGSFAGGKLFGGMMGGAGDAAGATSTNAISGPMTESIRPMPRPEGLGTAAGVAKPSIFDAGTEFAKSAAGIGSTIGGMLPGMLPPESDNNASQGPYTSNIEPMQRNAQMPGPNFQPGISGEFDYGISAPQTREYASRYAPQRLAAGGAVENPYAENYARERDYGFRLEGGRPTSITGAKGGGTSGLFGRPQTSGDRIEIDRQQQQQEVDMPRPEPREPVRQVQAATPTPFNLTSTVVAEELDKSSDRKAQGGKVERMVPGYGPVEMQAGGIANIGASPMQAAPQPNEREVISAAISAIQGQHPQPEIALATFLQQYGEDALRDLVDRVQSGEMGQTAAESEGRLAGPGDGMSDMIPATVEGQSDVLLSDGEYIVPADVVSHLGNGSTDAGARALDEMRDRVRTERTGTTKQAPAVPQEQMMPV